MSRFIELSVFHGESLTPNETAVRILSSPGKVKLRFISWVEYQVLRFTNPVNWPKRR